MLIAINWYSGAHSVPVIGELRMAVGSATYSLPFTFDAGNGNGGKGIRAALDDGIAANDKWLIIDPKAVLRL